MPSTLSPYVCPACGHALRAFDTRRGDLFCDHCYTSVAILDDQSCLYQVPDSPPITCPIEVLRPRSTEA